MLYIIDLNSAMHHELVIGVFFNDYIITYILTEFIQLMSQP